MTGQRSKVVDWRSTGRKRGRKTLFREERVFACSTCGRSSKSPPPDAPSNFEDFWPEGKRVLEYSLQVNHINKDVRDNDPANLEWLCSLCHKMWDSQTRKGAVDSSEFGLV